MLKRLITYWVYGGALAGVLLLLLTPLLSRSWSVALTLTFLHLPMYMLHQYEEHDRDRFRLFFNKTIGRGREVLSPAAVFVINVPGVWGVIVVAVYLAAEVNIGLGLIAVYLAVVNAFVHIIHAIVFRCYNPGLGTAVGLFLPVGTYSIYQLHTASGGAAMPHLIGLFVAVGLHVAIVVYVLRRGAFSGTA